MVCCCAHDLGFVHSHKTSEFFCFFFTTWHYFVCSTNKCSLIHFCLEILYDARFFHVFSFQWNYLNNLSHKHKKWWVQREKNFEFAQETEERTKTVNGKFPLSTFAAKLNIAYDCTYGYRCNWNENLNTLWITFKMQTRKVDKRDENEVRLQNYYRPRQMWIHFMYTGCTHIHQKWTSYDFLREDLLISE